MAVSIREKQIAALKRMLNLNAVPTKASLAEPAWKVLVYDRFGQDVISPLLSVKELRDMGVTLHLLLHSDRDPIPDVPAVYFVLPTEENVQRICQDFQNQTYVTYYLNFISAISRQRLEDLASAALQSNVVSLVSKVFDQYLNFITLEDHFFTVRHQNRDSISYHAINRSDVKDTEMDSIMDTIVDSLFSFFVTMGTVPIIRSAKGNAAEMVAEKLDKKLRENLRDARNSLFTTDTVQSGQISFQRPLLVILDRNMDMATPLHHTWTYQALSHDVLDLQLNRVTLEETVPVSSPGAGAGRTRKKVKSYDLSCTDRFWIGQKGNPFPEVAEAVQSELDAYRASEDEVKKLKSAMGLEGEDEEAISLLSDTTAKLTSAVSSLPELLEKKRHIDMHMNIATALLDHIKARKLDVYFELEEKLMSKQTLDKSLMDVISDPDAGLPEDKMRLFIIFYICSPSVPDSEVEQYRTALEVAGCNLAPLDYIKRWKAFSKMSAPPSQYGGGGTKTVGMFSKLMSTGSNFVMEGVKNFVVKKHNLPVTRVVDSLMELKSNTETDDYRYFDPKLLRMSDRRYIHIAATCKFRIWTVWFCSTNLTRCTTAREEEEEAKDRSSIPRTKTPYQEAIVFVVGGGNYIEYQNLLDYVKSKSSTGVAGKKISYGCSEVLNSAQFMKQITLLGEEH